MNIESGEVWSCGSGYSGRLGHGTEEQEYAPKRIEYFVQNNIKIEKIACGGGHSMAISDKGEVRYFGWFVVMSASNAHFTFAAIYLGIWFEW